MKEIFMMKKFSKVQTVASLLLATVFFLQLNAQENERENYAKQIFKTYYKFGLVVGTSSLAVTNEENAVKYEFKRPQTFDIGVEYNFYQIKNWNFRAAFILQNYTLVNEQYLKKEDIPSLYNDESQTIWFGPFQQFKIPMYADYFLQIGNKTSFNFSLGPEFIIYPDDPTSGSTGVNGVEYISEEGFGGGLFVGLNGSIGFNWKMKGLLLKSFITYHYQNEVLYTNTVTTSNLEVSPNTVSKHEITGDYFMFGVSVYPSKSLFKKKK